MWPKNLLRPGCRLDMKSLDYKLWPTLKFSDSNNKVNNTNIVAIDFFLRKSRANMWSLKVRKMMSKYTLHSWNLAYADCLWPFIFKFHMNSDFWNIKVNVNFRTFFQLKRRITLSKRNIKLQNLACWACLWLFKYIKVSSMCPG